MLFTNAQFLAGVVMPNRPGKPTGLNADPVFRHQRALKAGEAARLAHLQRAYALAGQLHPIEAYARGYTTGYKRAYSYWRSRLAREAKAS